MSPPLPASTASSAAPRQRPSKPSRRDQSAALELVAPSRVWVRVLGPMALGSVFAVLLLLAVFHALIVQGQRELDRLSGDVAVAQLSNDRLLLDLALKETPQRIVEAARAFGMVEAPEVKYLSPANNVPITDGDETELSRP